MFQYHQFLVLLILGSQLLFLRNLLLVNDNDRFTLNLSTVNFVDQVLDLIQAVEDVSFDLDAGVCNESNLGLCQKYSASGSHI